MGEKLKDYVNVSRDVFSPGFTVPAEIQMHLPLNDTMIVYRQKHHIMTQNDVDALAKVEIKNLYIKQSLQELVEQHYKAFIVQQALENPTPESLGATGNSILKSLNGSSLFPSDVDSVTPEAAQSVLDTAFEITQGIMKKSKSPSAEAFFKVLEENKGDKLAPIDQHQRNVSSLAVLTYCSLGNLDQQDMVDLAYAGLIHDLALKNTSTSLTDRHLSGSVEFNNQEKLIYMRHPKELVDKLVAQKANLTKGSQKIIEQHHENWDGSGFNGIAGNQVYYAARILHVIDDLEPMLTRAAGNLTISKAFEELKKRKGFYDESIMGKLEKILSTK